MTGHDVQDWISPSWFSSPTCWRSWKKSKKEKKEKVQEKLVVL